MSLLFQKATRHVQRRKDALCRLRCVCPAASVQLHEAAARNDNAKQRLRLRQFTAFCTGPRHDVSSNSRWRSFIERLDTVALRSGLAPAIGFFRARLSPTGNFGLHLTVGALVLVAASWMFGEIAEDVIVGKPITLVDAQLTAWLQFHAVPEVTTSMLLITHLHGLLATGCLAMLLGAFLVWKREYYWLLALVLAVPGGMLVNVLMKLAFQRARPSFPDPILTLTSYSFPSGHVAAATCFYGVVLAFIFAQVESWRLRVGAAILAALIVALIALSRVYLGAHYLSDVLAAFAEGIAWVAICLTAVRTLRLRRAARASVP